MLKHLGYLLAVGVCIPANAAGMRGISSGSYGFSIGTYNVENLWDANSENTPSVWEDFLNSLPPESRTSTSKQTLQYDDYSREKSNWYESNILNIKLEHVLKAIKLANIPDILCLQEFESAGNGTDIFNTPMSEKTTFRSHLKKLGYEYFLIGAQARANPTSVTTAIISKLPLTVKESVVIDFPNFSTSGRDIQVVELKENDSRVLIFNGHWKSKAGGGSERERIATAKLVRERITRERAKDPQVGIIVLGDLNAAYYEKPMAELGALGNERAMLTQRGLYNLWFELPEEDRWESSFNGVNGTLSNIIISDDFYRTTGFQYVDQSFHVVGQQGPAAKILLNADGIPFRWQIKKRGGHSTHIGQGYSDHLALVAQFQYIPTEDQDKNEKIDLDNPSEVSVLQKPERETLPNIKACQENESANIETVDFKNPDSFIKKCFKISVQNNKPALAFKTHGPFNSNYVDINGVELGLVMNRAWDWRPNINDSRVNEDELQELQASFDENNWHPHSNKCFNRKVLQGQGGSVRKAVGHLDYVDGELALVIASRESAHLMLENLPSSKAAACPW